MRLPSVESLSAPMLLASLLLSVLISSIVVRSDVPVPKAWKMKMARAATFADLAHNFNIVYTSNATNHRSNEVKIYGKSKNDNSALPYWVQEHLY